MQIEAGLQIYPRTGKKRAAKKDDFIGAGAMYLQEKSQFDYLVNLTESEDIVEAVNNSMKLIEKDYKDLQGILPKNYQDFDANLLRSLIRVFNKDEVKENDYSLTPGRYVGYSIKIDEDFDYKARMKEIHSELAGLNMETNELKEQILSVKP